eukprot:TRINITY_DN14057_c0_g1_i1.p1 TRINITY_DN14057_c0_g1~~TRINITY_DN14057_c0_g1_i1.p1  ORF type:complete len:637 (+),score=74.35 TRINITY_DN14057_c0_g1_i1:82-1992(+)
MVGLCLLNILLHGSDVNNIQAVGPLPPRKGYYFFPAGSAGHKRTKVTMSDGFMNTLKHWLLRLYFQMIIYIFYREVDVIGEENIPPDRPIIFCGNHQNQFVDALMLYTSAPRTVGFIIAAKSMKRQIVGSFARFCEAIPVVRPQDEARRGSGKIITVTTTKVTGQATKFKSEVAAGELISSTPVGEKASIVVKVLEVVSDTVLTTTSLTPVDWSGEACFQILPKIDHNVMYKAVYSKLGSGGCIGIFPEGGSHDQTSLLPMKDGVAKFALGAKQANINPVVIPVGLTYYYGHRFRSRAHVEFGKPIDVDDDLLGKDPKQATHELLQTIENGMRNVTINAPDWKTLKYVHHIRRLYQPGRIKLPVSEVLELTRQFAVFFDEFKSEPLLIELCEQLDGYQTLLKEYLLTDAQVESLDTLETRTRHDLLFQRMLLTAMNFIASIPGLVISLPVGIAARIYSTIRAEQDLKASSVKLRGNDVIASHKIISSMVVAPILILFYAAMVMSIYGFQYAALTVLLLPPLSFMSICNVYRAMLGARSTFPLLLSLHSPTYFSIFRELYKMRKSLSNHVMLIVETHFRNSKNWNDNCEGLYQRILLDRSSPHSPLTQSDPFTAAHTSRLTKRKNRVPRVMSSDSIE